MAHPKTPLPFSMVVPAAGSGRRFGADIPKQYLTIDGVAIAQHTLQRLLKLPGLQKIAVAIGSDDQRFFTLPIANHPQIMSVVGGVERGHSVLNGLDALSTFAAEDSWVLVHDIARPCCPLADIQRLLNQLGEHPVGGILAIPANDTLKRVNAEQRIEATVDRDGIWLAQTPQMFRLGLLRQALRDCLVRHLPVTDEASAIEHAGLQPQVVLGSRGNIKITHTDDLALAAFFLQQFTE